MADEKNLHHRPPFRSWGRPQHTRMTVCARAAKESGELMVKVTAEGLPEAEIALKVE